MRTLHKNIHEDNKLLLDLGVKYEGEPFTLVFTAGTLTSRQYVCKYDGTDYTNCVKVDDTNILCLLDNANLPCGYLNVTILVVKEDSQMPDGDFKICDTRRWTGKDDDGEYWMELWEGASDTVEISEMNWTLLAPVLRGEDGATVLTPEQMETITQSVIDNLGDTYAAKSHTHTKSQITDFPSIPSTASDISTTEGISEGKNVQADLNQIAQDLSKKYEKDSAGIPLTDLTSSVQTSISRADEIYDDYIATQNIM